jgi:hypothetical protein
MIKHVVMWRLKEENPAEKLELARTLKLKLENLKNMIPEIVQIEAGINMNPSEAAFDVVLYSLFVTEKELTDYQNHPEHVKIGEFLKEIVTERTVVDYEV